MPTKTKPMTEGAPWLHVLKFSLPVLAGSTMQQLYNTVDAIVVGNYSGEDALAAVGTTGSFIFLLHAIAIGLSAGTGVVVAQFYGANDQRQVRANAASGASFLLTLGAILTILGIAVSRPAFDAFVGVPDDFLEQTLLYFRLYCVGLVFQFGYWSFSSILRGVGDSAATLYFLLISSILNIALDVLFVAYFKWGVAGAAIATDVAEGVAFFAAFFYMVRRYPVFRFRLEDYRWNAAAIMRTVRVGAPISAQLLVVAFGFTLIQRAVNDFGQAMTAAFTVGQRIDMYLSLPGHAFQTTLATFAGQNIGANKLDRARQGAMQTLLVALAMAIAISIFVFLFSDEITALFGVGDQAAKYSRAYLRAAALTNIVLTAYIPLFGLYQAANHSAFPMVVATCALTVRTIVVYLFRYSPFLGYSVVWWNSAFGFGVGFTVTWIFFFSGLWKKNARIAVESAATAKKNDDC